MYSTISLKNVLQAHFIVYDLYKYVDRSKWIMG